MCQLYMACRGLDQGRHCLAWQLAAAVLRAEQLACPCACQALSMAPEWPPAGSDDVSSQAATATTYMQMRGPSTAYDMQTYLLKIEGIWLHKAFASIRCSSHQLLVQTGRYHVYHL